MGKFYPTIPKSVQPWILEQKMFIVGTAPLSGDGHVNVSPKGGEYFGIIDERTFWYMDLTGSGVETISHLNENSRITVMFMAFDGSPRILRLYGRGTVYEYDTSGFRDFVAKHNVELIPGSRSIIIVDVHQVGTSCGFSVPKYDFVTFRQTLNEVFEKRYAKDWADDIRGGQERYWATKSQLSNDGLPGMKLGMQRARKERIGAMEKMVGPGVFNAPNGERWVNPVGTTQVNTAVLVAVFTFLLGLLLGVVAPTIAPYFLPERGLDMMRMVSN